MSPSFFISKSPDEAATGGNPYAKLEPQFMDFKFFPIEPPRPPDSKRESYARRQHQFSPSIVQPPPKSPLFRKSSSTQVPWISENPPKISIDGRLPDPAIITCNEPLPLRLLISKQNDSPDTIFLQMLQIELIGYTFVRAHDYTRQESTSWMLMSLSDLQMPCGGSQTSAPKEMEVNRALWDGLPLPNTVAPTFETCNLSRQYILEIKVGLAYGSPGNIKVGTGLPTPSCATAANRHSPNWPSSPFACRSKCFQGLLRPKPFSLSWLEDPPPSPYPYPSTRRLSLMYHHVNRSDLLHSLNDLINMLVLHHPNLATRLHLATRMPWRRTWDRCWVRGGTMNSLIRRRGL